LRILSFHLVREHRSSGAFPPDIWPFGCTQSQCGVERTSRASNSRSKVQRALERVRLLVRTAHRFLILHARPCSRFVSHVQSPLERKVAVATLTNSGWWLHALPRMPSPNSRVHFSIIRDVFQNHLLQIFTLVAMEVHRVPCCMLARVRSLFLVFLTRSG